MGKLTRENVLDLAPDAASAKSGQGLASPRKWVSMGMDEGAVWGECQGSGKNPYQVQVDLSELAFKCSCPSRKFPCKHGLGLMLMYAAGIAEMKPAARPSFVAEWLASRAQRAEKKSAAAKVAEPVDPEALAEKRSSKMAKVSRGLLELETWLLDLVRHGTAGAPSQGYGFFDGMARRMIDAQAPGAARLVRELASVASGGAGWQTPFLEKLASLHVLTQAVSRFEQLPEPMQMDVFQALGLAITADQLASLPGVRDQWSIVAQQSDVEDRLRVRRTWLVGTSTPRIATVLHFAHAAAPMDTSLVMGTTFEGELVFYPGHTDRAAVRARDRDIPGAIQLNGHTSVAAALDAVATTLADQPWTELVPIILRQVIPTESGGNWYVVDADGDALPIGQPSRGSYIAAAISGGQPIDVMGLLGREALALLSLSSAGVLVSIATNRTDDSEAR